MTDTFVLPSGPLVAWYGDDFTGSAAVMEVLAFNGIASVLYLAPPDAALQRRFGNRQGIGIAGDARSRSPAWMQTALPPVFAALRATGARIIQYKVCSTFDSAPDLGSIGCAADIAAAPFCAMVVPAPRIGRWQAFGNLFARSGAHVARLDRHTMANHPTTPMREADVRLHLGAQTRQAIGLVDVLALQSGGGAQAFAAARNAGARIVAFDVIDAQTLCETGATLWSLTDAAPLFVIGSQGVEDALVAHWAALGHVTMPATPAAPVDRIAVISGSCSPETAQQITNAVAAGFEAVRVDATKATDPAAWQAEAARLLAAANDVLSRGASPILFTAMGPDDPAIARADTARVAAGIAPAVANATLAAGLGAVLARLADQAGLRRVAIAGGDTSSHATAQLGIVALTAEAAIAPAVPLMHGHRADERLAPIEVILKGGQMGLPDLFCAMRDGPGGRA